MKKYPLIIGFVAVTVLYAALLFHFTPKDPIQNSSALIENAVALPAEQQPLFGLPIGIKIPAINLDAAVESVGLTSGGAVDVPKDVNNAAWFNLGPRPGENGTAIIDGHYGVNKNKFSAFDNLYKLRPGDKIYIQDSEGQTITFVVTKNRRYDPKADATSVFNSGTDGAHLNLITCEGDWSNASKGYTERLVVFADRE